MKVYLANFFSKKAQVADYAEELKALGIGVTSRWFNESIPHNAEMSEVPEAYHRETAVADVEDILNADAFVIFTSEPADLEAISKSALARGGRHWETGFAFAAGKEVILCGQRENVFHYLPDVLQFDTWADVKDYLTLAKGNEYQTVEACIFG